jgi:hypothetical protein
VAVGAVVTRPSLRTGQVVFSHPALQRPVSRGEKAKLARCTTIFLKMILQREIAMVGKVRVGPTLMIMTARTDAALFGTLAQQTAQAATQPAVQCMKLRLHIADAEEVEPAPLNRFQFGADRLQTAGTIAPGQITQCPPQFVHALLASPAFFALGSASPENQNPRQDEMIRVFSGLSFNPNPWST